VRRPVVCVRGQCDSCEGKLKTRPAGFARRSKGCGQKRRAVAKGKLAVFVHTLLTDGRTPPVLSSAFPRSYHIDPSPIPLGAAPKTVFLLRSIFLFIFFFPSNILVLPVNGSLGYRKNYAKGFVCFVWLVSALLTTFC